MPQMQIDILTSHNQWQLQASWFKQNNITWNVMSNNTISRKRTRSPYENVHLMSKSR